MSYLIGIQVLSCPTGSLSKQDVACHYYETYLANVSLGYVEE